MRKLISVIFVEYDNIDVVINDIKKVAEQKVSADLEVIISDSLGLLENVVLPRELPSIASIKYCANENDTLGLLEAKGEFIAICKNGDVWRNPEKLAKQLEILEDSSCMLVFHDVELIKEDGWPVDQDFRNRFIANMAFNERYYTISHLQKFKSCGLFGTWMFRNIFLNPDERNKYINCSIDDRLLLLTMLVANGSCQNLLDDRFIAIYPDREALNKKVFPKYDLLEVSLHLKELDEVRTFLSTNYDIDVDGKYRQLSIANGLFNYIGEKSRTKEELKELLAIFIMLFTGDTIKDNEKITTVVTEEKSFRAFLRRKIWKYVINSNNSQVVELVPCLEDSTVRQWLDGINRCKNSFVKEALVRNFKEACLDAEILISDDKKAKNPLVVYPKKFSKRVSRVFNKITSFFKRCVCFYLRKKKGFSAYMANEWYETVRKDFFSDKETPLKFKLWCYRRGFMPWRIPQYGITKENVKEFLSDRDYMYLHQINNSYKKWIEDKMTFRLVLEPFKKNLPKYYYQIIQRDDKQLIVSLGDLPDGYKASFDELFRLLRNEGKLALKAAAGTHGVGFYKVEYADGKYYLNNKEVGEIGIRNTINSFRSFYIVTEYINMHDDIKNIFAGSVNTIRVMMINRDGHHPKLMDAYMRIGTEKSGVTDNVAFGGVVCSVNLETGEYGNGLQLVNHEYISIDKHPDTGTPLNGVLPNWELIKKGLLDISQYLSQLEYLGFDVVCTPEGFVILEVNSHQDLHRLPSYSQEVRDFFAYKLRRKERRYKIKRNY